MVWIIIGQKSTNTGRRSKKALHYPPKTINIMDGTWRINSYQCQYNIPITEISIGNDSAKGGKITTESWSSLYFKQLVFFWFVPGPNPEKDNYYQLTKTNTRVVITSFQPVLTAGNPLLPPMPSMPPPPATRAGTNSSVVQVQEGTQPHRLPNKTGCHLEQPHPSVTCPRI